MPSAFGTSVLQAIELTCPEALRFEGVFLVDSAALPSAIISIRESSCKDGSPCLEAALFSFSATAGAGLAACAASREKYLQFVHVDGEILEAELEHHMLNAAKPLQLSWRVRCYMYMLEDSSVIIHHALNEGVVVESLEEEDADLVDSTWAYRSSTSRAMIAALIAKQPSVAVRVNGTLVSWCLLNEHGAIGMLYTKEEHRGRGYAALAVDALANLIRTQHCEAEGAVRAVYSHVVTTNAPSIKLFERLGWKKLCRADWCLFATAP